MFGFIRALCLSVGAVGWVGGEFVCFLSKVPFTKHKANSAAWIIKKTMNLHGRLQKKTSKRRDEELQEFTDS